MKFNDALINLKDNPDAITNEIIQAIGKSYKETYPIGRFYTFFFSHHSHPLADKLINYDLDSSSKEKWLFLLEIYKQLNNIYSSKLGNKIEDAFKSAFNFTHIDKHDITNDIGVVITPRSEEAIINDLNKIIQAHYEMPTVRANAGAIELVNMSRPRL